MHAAVRGEPPFSTKWLAVEEVRGVAGVERVRRKPGNGANSVDVHSQPLPTRSETPKALSPAGMRADRRRVPARGSRSCRAAGRGALVSPRVLALRRRPACRRPRDGTRPRSAAQRPAQRAYAAPRRGSRTPAIERQRSISANMRGSATRRRGSRQNAGCVMLLRRSIHAQSPVAPQCARPGSRRRRTKSR